MMTLRRLFYALFFYGGTVVFVLTATLFAPFSDHAVKITALNWSGYQNRVMRWIGGIDVKLEGALPEGPLLFAVKHESYFEAIDIPRFLSSPAIMAKAELLAIPFWGMVARRYGLIGVDRAGGAKALRSMLTRARAMLAEERQLMIFPEGTRVAPGDAPPLQAGFAGLYKLLALPVVPIAIDSGRYVTRGGLPKRTGTITYRIAQTIPAGLPRSEVEERVHAAINALNDAARSAEAGI